MALNTTGQISLAGTTTGQSIELELGGNGTTQISLNDSTVRALAGVPTGQIVMPTNFYGKSSGATTGIYAYGATGTTQTTKTNQITRINACGALVGSETNAGTAIYQRGGAKANSNAVFYAGNISNVRQNLTTRINICGALVGSETNVGTARYIPAGTSVSSGTIGMFYAGNAYGRACVSCIQYCASAIVTRINSSGTIVGSETVLSTTRRSSNAGATIGSNGVYYGGNYRCCGSGYQLNAVARINACGALVGSETNVGLYSYNMAATQQGSTGIYYAGFTSASNIGAATVTNNVVRINACGTQIGSTTTIGTARSALGGSAVGSNAVFYGGVASSVVQNLTTRINICGALVGSQTNVGTAKQSLAGAGGL